MKLNYPYAKDPATAARSIAALGMTWGSYFRSIVKNLCPDHRVEDYKKILGLTDSIRINQVLARVRAVFLIIK